MADSKRTYSKVSLEKELKPQLQKKVIEVNVVPIQTIDQPAESYIKSETEIPPKTFLVIVSGGEVREKDYFKIVSNHDVFKRVKLEFIADPYKLSPDGLFEVAKYKKNRFGTSKNTDAEPDKYYLISDVDHFKNELIRIKPKCKKEDFILIISNSCFEIWLYYAYCVTIPNFPLPSDPLKISGKFKGWLPSVIPGGVKPKKAILNIYINIDNAKMNYSEDSDCIPVLFSTNMFLLAEELLPLIEPELTNMIEENKRIEEKFRDRKK